MKASDLSDFRTLVTLLLLTWQISWCNRGLTCSLGLCDDVDALSFPIRPLLGSQ